MPHAFKIGGSQVEPGERKTIDLSLARLFTHTDMGIPIHVVHGKRSGPKLFVSAAIHGDEINGVEIIRRLLRQKILKRLRGTLIAIPFVNVYGFLNQNRYSPDRRDLNRFFPGSETGSLTSQLAHLFMKEVVDRCSHGIDLHTGSNHRSNLPQIRAYLDDSETERLANAFGAPVILDADLLEGSLRQAVKDRGIPVLLYEAGEVLRFDETSIRTGLRGILSVMRAIEMLPAVANPTERFVPVVATSSTWVRAPRSGIVNTQIRLGDRVVEKTKIAEVVDPFSIDEFEVLASATGVVIGQVRLPLVHRGDALFHIARFNKRDAVSETLEAFRQEFEPDW